MAGKVNPIQSYQEATNQLLAINEQRKGALNQAKMEENLEASRNNTLAQASEFIASQPQQVNTQAASLNPATQNILGRYGLGQPKMQRTSSSSQTVTKQNVVINNKNTNITNNNVSVPANIGGPVQSRPIQFQDPGQIKFKTWLSNSFAQQNEQAAKRQREYEKRDSALIRNSNKLMKRLEETGKKVATSLNPKNMASNVTNQLRTLFMVLGLGYIARNWPKYLNKINDIQTKVKGIGEFFTKEGGGLTKILGGKDNEKPFEAFKNLFIDKDTGIFRYLKDVLRNFLDERSKALSNIPKPDFKIESGLGIEGNLSKLLSNLTTYLGNILQTLMSPEAGLRSAMETSIKNENTQNINNYYYSNHKKFDREKTEVVDSNGNKSNVAYEDTSGALFKENGFKGVLPGSFDKRTGNLISNTQEIQGEISQGMDVARNIKEASRKGGSINTSDVAAGLSRLNIKAHESGHVYLDRDSIESLGVTPEEINAKKITGRYIVVPRSIDLQNLDYQAELRDRGGFNSSTQAMVEGFEGGWTPILSRAVNNEIMQKQSSNNTEEYHTVLIDENDLAAVEDYLKAEGKPYKVLEKTQDDIYKISEEQMRFITEKMGVKLGESRDIASDLSLSNREYLDAVNNFLESKSDYDYYNSPEYKEYEKQLEAYKQQVETLNTFHPENIIEETVKEAANQLIESKNLSFVSKEAAELYKKPLHKLFFELLKQHEDLTKRINNRDLREGETLADLYEEDTKIQELINKIRKYFTYKDASGNELSDVKWSENLDKALADPERKNVLLINDKGLIGDGHFELKEMFKPVEPVEPAAPQKPAVRKSDYKKFSEGLDEYYALHEQNKQKMAQEWRETRAHAGAEYTGSALSNFANNVKDRVSSVIPVKDVKKVNPSDVNSGDLSGVIAASKRGVFYSNSSGGYIPLGKDLKGFMHKCTSGPATFYEDGSGGKIKLNGKWWNTGSPKTATGTNIDKEGFKCVWTGTHKEGWDTNSIRSTGFELQPGDIMLNFGYSGNGTSSHAEMWNGEEWISDTHQGQRAFVYRKGGRLGNKSAQIWRYDAGIGKQDVELASEEVEMGEGLLDNSSVEAGDIAFENENPFTTPIETINSNNTSSVSFPTYNPYTKSNVFPTFTPENTMADNFPSLGTNNSDNSASSFEETGKSETHDYTRLIDGIDKNTGTSLAMNKTGFETIESSLEEIKSILIAGNNKKSTENKTNYITAESMTDNHFNSLFYNS